MLLPMAACSGAPVALGTPVSAAAGTLALAAPARATDLTGLPPTFMDVGDMDLFRDEDIAFASRLVQAGIPTEFHLYPGAYHASEVFAPAAELSQRIWSTRIQALTRALHG